MKQKSRAKPVKSKGWRAKSAAVAVAGAVASMPVAPATATAHFSDDVIAKLSSGALRRLLINLRAEDGNAGGGETAGLQRTAADFISHISYGQHGSHSQSIHQSSS